MHKYKCGNEPKVGDLVRTGCGEQIVVRRLSTPASRWVNNSYSTGGCKLIARAPHEDFNPDQDVAYLDEKIAHAYGYPIQVKSGDEWVDCPNPKWFDNNDYRIKPFVNKKKELDKVQAKIDKLEASFKENLAELQAEYNKLAKTDS